MNHLTQSAVRSDIEPYSLFKIRLEQECCEKQLRKIPSQTCKKGGFFIFSLVKLASNCEVKDSVDATDKFFDYFCCVFGFGFV